jgi:hypothetical protein
MANFISNAASAELTAATLDLSTGNYYAHLVTTVPLLTHSTAADLVLPTTSGYASAALTGLSYNSTRWTFDSFSFPKYNFVTAPTGVAICKRAGTTPASTDRFICYSDFNNSIGQSINVQVGIYVVNLQFGTNGAINFSYKYQYASGIYANTETIPKGLIYLIGSRNNTITFADPEPAKIAKLPTGTSVTNRNSADGPVNTGFTFALDLNTFVIRPGTIGIYNFYPTTGIININIWDSNNLSNNFPSNYANTSLYTQLGNFSITTGWNYVMKTFDVNSTIFWRYFLFQITSLSSSLVINEVEFYNSSIIAPTLNMV